MRKLLLFGFAALIIIVAVFVLYVKLALPNVGKAPDLKITGTPEMVERGKYLANHVMVCADCHSMRDFGQFAAPVTGKFFSGGSDEFTSKYGAPGDFYAPNLTPHNLKNWTDGEIYRAITTGVSKDGHALFPIMPYLLYGHADPEDIKAVIAYLRTVPSDEREVPKSRASFPVSFFLNMMPQKAQPVKRPDPGNTFETGKYLTTVAGCIECHTPLEKGKPNFAKAFQGGREFLLPTGTVRSSNLTPDPKNYMGQISREGFVARFRAFADSAYIPPRVVEGFNTVMPWNMYAKMNQQDLESIYDYLHTLQPVENNVEKFSAGSTLPR